MSYKEKTIEDVDNEYYEYLLLEVMKQPNEILKNSPKSEFYDVIHSLICENDSLTENDYKKLHCNGNNILANLYNSYTSSEGSALVIQNCFFGILTNHIDRQLSNLYM